ncbi:hypothetical protein ES707_11671 [subsurface metagenome]
MKKSPAQLKAARKYYNNKVTEGYIQLNVLVKKHIVTALKDYANNTGLSIQKGLSEILKKGLNVPEETESAQEKPPDSWD